MGIEQSPDFIGLVIGYMAQVHQMVGHGISLSGIGCGYPYILALKPDRARLPEFDTGTLNDRQLPPITAGV
ncbi:hypothetical protein MSSD14B_03990 [Marinobacter salsuginis]|uniref:Uncharacterized protein n=1 Tax=Marinobacter salsuginis TaxID=418719 RepID=A0A5M3PV94_9GAMM|nr:hypothetical protein MSSD14B_03990 [Marinobacter salsuginis]